MSNIQVLDPLHIYWCAIHLIHLKFQRWTSKSDAISNLYKLYKQKVAWISFFRLRIDKLTISDKIKTNLGGRKNCYKNCKIQHKTFKNVINMSFKTLIKFSGDPAVMYDEKDKKETKIWRGLSALCTVCRQAILTPGLNLVKLPDFLVLISIVNFKPLSESWEKSHESIR